MVKGLLNALWGQGLGHPFPHQAVAQPHGVPFPLQMADAMEMMILSILAPQLHCEWQLPSWQVALLTSVGDSFHSRTVQVP